MNNAAPKRRLDVLQISDPCTEDWSKMRGDEKVRFCDLCAMNVYNISVMDEAEATSLISEHEGRLCIRFFRRQDGTVVTRDCAPDRLRAVRRLGKRTLRKAIGIGAAALACIAGLGSALSLLHVDAPDLVEIAKKILPEEVEELAGEMGMDEPYYVPVQGIAPPYIESPPSEVEGESSADTTEVR